MNKLIDTLIKVIASGKPRSHTLCILAILILAFILTQ